MSLLRENPLLLLFLVASLGYVLGRVRVYGFSLGVAAVLFVGLGVGAIDRELRLPEFSQQLGLALFVYTIGLGSGAGFFQSLRRRGLRDLTIVAGAVAVSAGLTILFAKLTHTDDKTASGLFAGALTNTPALAAVVDVLAAQGADEAAKSAPVVAYSLAYPASVTAVLLSIFFARRKGAESPETLPLSRRPPSPELNNVIVRIGRDRGEDARTLAHGKGYGVMFGRMKRGELVSLVVDDTRFRAGDLVSVVGREPELRAAVRELGEETAERIDLDRTVVDYRRIFVSRAEACEIPLRELALPTRFGAVITRIRRGDVDLLPDAETELELGDRVRVVAPRERLAEVGKFLGDSYRALAEIDVLTFGLGITLGLLLGTIAVPLPGGGTFKLGLAGGPLIAGLLLGRLGRSGPLVWTLPFSANLTLRQIGLVLFLASVGTRSGNAFVSTLRTGHGGSVVIAGALIAVASASFVLYLGKRLKMPLDVVTGVVSGVQTQPAALAFAVERAGSDQPNVGYASVFPLATILKIVVAQLLLSLLR